MNQTIIISKILKVKKGLKDNLPTKDLNQDKKKSNVIISNIVDFM